MREVATRTFHAVCTVCQRDYDYTRKTTSNVSLRLTCSAECLSALRQRRIGEERQRLARHCRPETAERIANLLLHDTTIGAASQDAVRQAEQRAQKERLTQAEDAPAARCPRCGAAASVEECPVWAPGRPPFVRLIARCSKWRGHATVVEERDLAPSPEPPTTEDTMSTTLALRTCADCGSDLTGRHHKARYCLACRQAHDEDTARRRSEDRKRQTSRPAIIACETCGVDVLVAESGPVPRYCPECRGSRKAEPCLEPASLTTPEAEPEPELPVEEIHDEADADDSPTLPDMAAQLLEWMPHLLALPEEEADLVVRLARAEARRRSA